MAPADPIAVIRELNQSWKSRPFEPTRELLLASADWDDAVARFEAAGLPIDPIDPDVRVVNDAFPGSPAPIGQRGRDAWIRFWQEWAGPLDDLVMEDTNYEQIGDHVVVDMNIVAHPRGGGTPIEAAVVQLFAVRDDLITLYGVYPNRDEALGAITDR
jgi:ketosteroid isomerase-like protein